MERSQALPIPTDRTAARFLPVLAMAGLTAVAARVEIPHLPVPYTLQTLTVLLSGALLGMRRGALSQVLYLLAGLAGLPVFAQGGAGILRLIGPTGGYLLSFPVAAFVVGYLLQGKPPVARSVMAMLTGSFVIFTLGTLQLYLVALHDLPAALSSGFLIFSWWDGVKIAAASAIATAWLRARRQG